MARCGAVVAVLAVVYAMSVLSVAEGGLVTNYYKNSCPRAEKIIRTTIYNLYHKKGNIATSFIRFGFHDFFNGADASFFLLGKNSEKDSHSMEGMRNEKYINDVKMAVDKVCPGVVSCADILAVAAAQSVETLGGPHIEVKTGRRDTRISMKASADRIPRPQDDLTKFLSFFAALQISPEEAVALMGAHTIGRAHCVSFKERIYPTVDPQMDPTFANMLKRRCPANPTAVHFTYFRNDEQSPMQFDNHYFVNLVAKQGLMGIDSKLYHDQRTKAFVVKFASNEAAWRATFATAFKKLSEIKPLTGKQGELRQRCMFVNPQVIH